MLSPATQAARTRHVKAIPMSTGSGRPCKGECDDLISRHGSDGLVVEDSPVEVEYRYMA